MAKIDIVPKYLYKYKTFDENNYWQDILLNNRLYMPPPSQFNDPFEGKLFPFDSGTCGNTINLATGQMNKDVGQYLDNYRVVCLSGNIRNKAMWAYYACDYRGFAIQFKTYSLKENYMVDNAFSKAQRVIYKSNSEEIPCKQIMNPSEADKALRKCLLYKSEDWAQEEEFRIIERVNKAKKKYLKFAPNDIESVILGIRMSEDNRKKITKICKEKNLRIRNMWLATIDSKIEFYTGEGPRRDGSSYKDFIDKDI